MTATIHHCIATENAFGVGERISRALSAAQSPVTAADLADARDHFTGMLTARLGESITYRPHDAFYIDLPAGLSDDAEADALASAEGIIGMEVSDLLEDAGLTQAMADHGVY